MATLSDDRRPWTPRYKWSYGLRIISYNKGGMRQKEGWNEKEFDALSELGMLGWEAYSVTQLNPGQFLVMLKLATPWDVDETAIDQSFRRDLEKAADLFG